ncbi:MAG: 16S rRNA (guanine(966)-N(2))-methyltransferase RsmD [Bacteroidota bacterium]|nr:16S rRNA (guanine(966)-N(2))-methyltransferase RsmD [Bacteroidota bacterium]
MRIISGIYKSRILKTPSSGKVRPTSDRAKETLFNVLNNVIDFEGIKCLDLFCGTGNLGLECISRGADMCYFIDEQTDLVIKNIRLLNAEDKSKVFKSKALSFLNKFTEKEIDVIFCDPPYSYEPYNELIEKISLFKTILILEHSKDFIVSKNFEKNVFLKKKIGTVNFTFFDFN